MKFLKIAFWGVLLLLVLPSGGGQRSAIYTNAQRTLEDIGGFCTRNPDVCDYVVSAIHGVGEKLSNTAKSIETMLYEAGIGVDRSQLQQPLADINAAEAPETTSSLYILDTLTDEDRLPGWNGPR